jgi:hypothetical protein
MTTVNKIRLVAAGVLAIVGIVMLANAVALLR